MPIKRMHYHDILDETECVSCGAPHRRVIYYNPDDFYWELAEETKPGNRQEYLGLQELPDRRDEGLHMTKVNIENGFCRRCIRLDAFTRFRGVFGWQAYFRRKDGTTYAVPHASEYARHKAQNKQEKCGTKEIPEW